MSEFIGKFVCYDQVDGGICWGRIKDEAVVNSMKGEKEVFILTDRYVRYVRGPDPKKFRRFHARGTNAGEDEFLETRKVRGDSILWKDKIDLENDIVDLSDVLGGVDNDTLFKAILSAKVEDGVSGETATEVGLSALLADDSLPMGAKDILKRRLGME